MYQLKNFKFFYESFAINKEVTMGGVIFQRFIIHMQSIQLGEEKINILFLHFLLTRITFT